MKTIKLMSLILTTILLTFSSCQIEDEFYIDVCCKLTEAGVTSYEIIDFNKCKNYNSDITGIAVDMSICVPALNQVCCAHTDDGWNYTFIIKDKSTCRDTPNYWENQVDMKLCE